MGRLARSYPGRTSAQAEARQTIRSAWKDGLMPLPAGPACDPGFVNRMKTVTPDALLRAAAVVAERRAHLSACFLVRGADFPSGDAERFVTEIRAALTGCLAALEATIRPFLEKGIADPVPLLALTASDISDLQRAIEIEAYHIDDHIADSAEDSGCSMIEHAFAKASLQLAFGSEDLESILEPAKAIRDGLRSFWLNLESLRLAREPSK